jgi:hypothetical protein
MVCLCVYYSTDFIFSYVQTLYGNPKHFATLKCLAAAECGGTKLTVKDEHPPKDKMPFNGVRFVFCISLLFMFLLLTAPMLR